MVFAEGGLKEIFRVLLHLACEQDSTPFDQNWVFQATKTLHENTSHGVLQAIGYKQYIELFQSEISAAMDQYPAQQQTEQGEEISENLGDQKKKLIAYLEGTLDVRADKLCSEGTENALLSNCIEKLSADTVKLTKKQRKWIQNRIYTNEHL